MNINNLDLKFKISIDQVGLFFELIPIAICITVPEDETFIYVNKSFEVLFKLKRNKILNDPTLDYKFISDENYERFKFDLKSRSALHDIKTEVVLFNGEKRNMIVSRQTITIDKKLFYITTATDITDQLKNDLEINALNKKLAFENSEKKIRTDALILANEELIIQQTDKFNRAEELEVINKELASQNDLNKLKTQELTAKNNQLIEAQRLGQIGSWEWDLLENTVHWTDELYRLYGQKPQKKTITGDNFVMQILPEDLNYVNAVLHKAIKDKTPFQFYYRITRLDDKIRFLSSEGKMVLDNQGAVIKLAGIVQDITDKKLASQYAYSRSLIEASLDPLVTLNTDGKITDMNQAMVNVTDKNRETLLNTSFSDYFTDSNKADDIYKKVFENGFVTNFPLTMKDCQLTHVLFNGSIFKDETGQVIGAVVVARDIGELKKNENKLQKTLRELSAYKYALDESSIVDLTDENGIIKYVNKNYCNISQYQAKEVIGKNFYTTDNPFFNENTLKIFWSTISNGGIWKGEMKNIAKDGTEYWTVTTIVPFLDDQKKPFQYMAISTNISEQKKIEIDLRDAKQIAENAVDAKQQFLSNMSHEIRTPMNAIIGFTKVVLKTNLTEKQKEYLTSIKLSGDALIVLINDILDLAKVNSGKLNFDKNPFKLSLSVQSMLHLFETKIQEKNIELIVKYDDEIPEILIGDAVRLNQIILNLVGNSVKFTSAGKITVAVKKLEENKKSVKLEFSISDTGIGINADKLELIFENFQQAHDTNSRLFGGTGLGLAIVKQLVEAQNGTISVVSETNVGSTFSFILDFEKTDIQNVLEAEILEIDGDIKDVSVLVVEDMQLNQLLMKTLLDDFGFECDIAENGQIAVEKIADKNYDVILMDIQMPVMNGLEATEFIRNNLKSNVPIIALTADVTTIDLEKCKKIGMNDYISKPVDERLLYSKIVGILKKPAIVIEHVTENGVETDSIKSINLDYLMQITKSNSSLMSEIIGLYLEQTPQLIETIKKSRKEQDWTTLNAAVHKIIPSFSIMGIDKNFEKVAIKIQEIAKNLKMSDDLDDLINQLDKVCNQACRELTTELKNLKK